MDLEENPCNNFYKFACGKFIKTATTGIEHSKNNSEAEIEELLYRRGEEMLKSHLGSGKTDRLIKDYFDSCMNTTKIEQVGLEPLKKDLNEVGIAQWPIMEADGWNNVDEDDLKWYEIWLKANKKGYSPSSILSTPIYSDFKGRTQSDIFFFVEPNLNLDRVYLVNGFDDKKVQHYYNFMVKSAMLLRGMLKRLLFLNNSQYISFF